MQSFQWYWLLVYSGFAIVATMLAFTRRWLRPNGSPSNVWQKYPLYVLLNLSFMGICFLPPDWHAVGLLVAAIGCCAGWEICRALCLTKNECLLLSAITAGLILSAAWLQPTHFVKIWLIALVSAVASSSLVNYHVHPGPRMLGMAACLGYLPCCLATFIWISQTRSGACNALFVYGVIATNDAFAQISGQLVGRHPLAPHISPAKTLEGAAGGVLFAALFGSVLGTSAGWDLVYGALLGAALALAGLIGDLTTSGWKRALGLKDFSQLLGAHGGVLDRFDAFIFAAPVFFLL